ncbi:neural-cadherin-like isoform X1 [Macrobrachium rosenbergii]|uniref:neural-cadherin-like isoform X1 n=1 Tax=Macrobrachium rosenbergii TaxID=79674 RepID=UPI0034D7275E
MATAEWMVQHARTTHAAGQLKAVPDEPSAILANTDRKRTQRKRLTRGRTARTSGKTLLLRWILAPLVVTMAANVLLPILFPLSDELDYPNVTKFLRMGLADKNDHPPFFEHNLYEVEVDEDEAINQTILSLNATDLDEVSLPELQIVEGNEDGTFAVGNLTGEVYLAQPLDYETKNRYNLLLLVSDGRHEGGATLQVNVKDINDNPPVFDRRLYEAEITEEDDRDLPRRLVTVRVTDDDIDRPEDIVFSLSGQGIDIENPENSHFAIDPSTGEIFVRKPLDRDYPGGRPRWGLTVFAQDEGGTGLVSYSEFVVKLKDVNDNPPRFTQAIYYGNVTENGTSGLEVITMKADDYDDPNEGTNAQLTYSIEKNVIDEVTGQPLFLVESNTGVVRTAVCCLDREETQDYLIQVVATDGGGLKGTGTVSILVLDINDKPPMFAKEEWVTETDETEGLDLPVQPILTVSVFDEDEKNTFLYKVIESSGFGADKFVMVTNPDGTGSLKVIKPLDYEDPKQRGGFKFQIQVSDLGENKITEPYHVATSWVKVKLKDINDNEPQFLKGSGEVQVLENSPIGTSLTTIIATDPDKEGESKVYYKIHKSSDRYRQFSIDGSGTLRVQRNLDRERNPTHLLRIVAMDDEVPPKSATMLLAVKVMDVNDNYPIFLEDYRPIIPENEPPRKVAEILATDIDDPAMKNGPPFHFWLDPKASPAIKTSFRVENIPRGLNEDGMAVVFSLREFDREEQKEYFVPIVIKDSGVPSMMGTSTLTVTIGDKNDHQMQPGKKDILFYSYMGQTHGTPVGRVYVEDKDDWDLSEKTFVWENSPHPNFKLEEDSGMIIMKYVPSKSSYNLNFFVHDRKHSQSNVKASVSVQVRHIPETAVENAGSIRIGNMTDTEFISQWDYKTNKLVRSKADQLRDKIAKLFGLKIYSVDLFSIQMKQERPPVTDVFFSVYDSQYYQSVKINGVVLRHRTAIEKAVGIKISMVGINECMAENLHCDGSCTNKFLISKSQYLIDANRTSFVGVHTRVVPECVCGARNFSTEVSCRPNPCLNRGRCLQEKYSVHCECSKGYDGPQCQILTRTFLGNGFAWFPPLEVCKNTHISVEFLSQEPEGLIFYNGPITTPTANEFATTDFIALELEKGQLRLLVDFGSGTLQLKVNTTTSLDDDKWHRVDIYWDKEDVRLDVDHCRQVPLQEEDNGIKGRADISRCRASGTIPPFNEYLNVNSPLQVGGLAHPPLPAGSYRWHHLPHGHHFKGCIRKLMVNSHFYDFANPALHSNTEKGCSYFDKVCTTNSTLAGCGPNGICSGSISQPVCLCDAGWTGAACDEQTIPSYFENQSYAKYALSFKPSSFHTDIQLRFRTWEKSGELLRMSNQHSALYGILEISENRLQFRFNLNALKLEENLVRLSMVNVSDGLWHSVVVKRYGTIVILTMDGGEGRNYNETSSQSNNELLDVNPQGGVTVGGRVQFSSIDVFMVHNDYNHSCLDDVRIEGKSLPLPPYLSGTQWAQATAFHNLASHCISRDQCLNVNCITPFICKDLWMRHECGCPEGSILTKDNRGCLDEDECLSGPCENGGICSNQQPSYVCHCPTGYYGDNCELVQEVSPLQPSLPAVAAIIVCILIVLVMMAVLLVCFCQKRRRRFSKDEGSQEGTEMTSKFKDDRGGGGRVLGEGEVTVLDLTALSVPTVSVVANGGTLIPKVKDVEDSIEMKVTMTNLDVVVASHPEMQRKYVTHQQHPSSYDDVRNYAYEGGGGSSSAGNSFSSLGDRQQQTKF